jgi:hypothetical protein
MPLFLRINIIMTALTRNPSNPNPLISNRFTLNFGRVPNVQYFCQNVTIPGISLSEAIITNPFVDIYSPGEKAIYDLLNVTFLIDEDLTAWKEIHDWIRAMTFPVEFAEYRQLPKLNKYNSASDDLKRGKFPQFSDASISIFSSSNTPLYRFRFHDVFPTTLSTFIMNTQDAPDNVLTADVTFRYSYYDIEKMF